MIQTVNDTPNITQSKSKFCFCTLALGHKYRALALLLAKDLQKYSPHTSFVVLTDNPSEFNQQSNVLAFKHQQQGVLCYHDKRFVIAKALSIFNSCIFIDADMRVLAPVPADMEWLKVPGVSARGCEIMAKKYAKVFAQTADKRLYKEFNITTKAAEKLDLKLEDEDVKFVYEYLFAVTKDCGKEISFLENWDMLARYFELNGVFDGEGNAIGLAAAKAGLTARWSDMEGISFFKDRTELVRIQKGQSKMEDMSVYFNQQRMIEHPRRSILNKVIYKIVKRVKSLYNFGRLIVRTLNDFEFYYR